MAEEMPYFKTMAYTEFATCFYLQPLNAKIRNEMMIDAWRDNVKDPVIGRHILYKILLIKKANKYDDRDDVTKKMAS